ncbi:hypothetical protein [Streptomyces sp. NPDC056160]|uniref:hypothetical protein n=1 Tax=Streptomyces sp. NPDC056160 TaxID=3345731 RepID=UPI0035DB8C41
MSASLRVRTGEGIPAYQPASSFRERAQVTQDGVDLWVCYVAPAERATQDYRSSLAGCLTKSLDDFSQPFDRSE